VTAGGPEADAPVLVTGATGNVGRPLVRALVAAGRPVRALVTDPARHAVAPPAVAPPGAGGSVERVRFDVTDASTFGPAFAGGGALFLLRPPAVSDAGVMRRAVDAARAAGVRRVAFLSIQGAATNPLLPHHAIERHLERLAAADAGFAYTFLRAAFFMQNLSTTHAADVRERGELFVPAGDGRTAFVDARDVAAAAARVLTDPDPAVYANRAYELTGPEALTYDEAAAVLTRVLGRPVVYPRPGALRFYREMRRRGHPRAFAAVMVALYTTARLGLAAHLSPELAGLLGRRPTSFAEFARDAADAWRPTGRPTTGPSAGPEAGA
jgi:uncharacterized protein YbjT (DUF2867 family)